MNKEEPPDIGAAVFLIGFISGFAVAYLYHSLHMMSNHLLTL